MIPVRIWAPDARSLDLVSDGRPLPLEPDSAAGWWRAELPGDTDYSVRVDGGEPLPDPRSLRQPHGINGPSRTYDHGSFSWNDQGWRGMPLAESIIYELHVGTFTAEGTFDAAISRLGYLRDLGVTTVELMPVAAFPGRHGWGYDVTNLWAVHEPYGGPDGLKRFIDACHRHGLAVLIDVVYNHLGIGNRLADFGPYFTDAHQTPWGPAVNLDQPGSDEVREFLIANALMWLRDYHADGLRLDAVHAFLDQRALHFLEELAVRAGDALLIAESDANDPRLVTARSAGGFGLGAQWSDDFHHALHAALTGERQGYYGDFGSMATLAKAYTNVFVHDGTWSSFRGRTHGRPVDVRAVPGSRFVGFIQDHDQVGNRAAGDRITATISADQAKVAAGLMLTSPFTPMLFMGEEWAASTPWQYFTDHVDPALAAAVAAGRREEFATHGWSAADVPDPQDPSVFLRSKLDWAERAREPHASMLAWYRELIALRRSRPELADYDLSRIRVEYDERARWLVVHRAGLSVAANLGTAPAHLPTAAAIVTGSCAGVSVTGNTLVLPPSSLAVLATRGPASRRTSGRPPPAG
jgi:maltooligosyltrehalose trehalohydrolase